MALQDGLALLFKIKSDSTAAESDIKRLRSTVSKELKEVEVASKSTATGMGGLGSQISSLLSPANLLAGAGVAAGAAIFAMGKQALDAAGELFDLSQKTNFSVESLSALKNAGETSGVSLGSLSSALGIFDKNIVAAATGNKELAATFGRLNISTKDNEQALRDAFRALSQMDSGAQQTAAAMELFGRSGKDVLGVIKETNGDLDAAIEKYRAMGTLVSTETARAADQLGDSITEVGQGLKGMALQLVEALGPALRGTIFLVGELVKAARGLLIVLNALAENPMLKRLEGTADLVRNAAGKVRSDAERSSTVDQPLPEDISGGATRIRAGVRGTRGTTSTPTPEKTADDYGRDLISRLKEQLTTLSATDDVIGKVAAQIANLEARYGKLSDAVQREILTESRAIANLEIQKKGMASLRSELDKNRDAANEILGVHKSQLDVVNALIAANERMNIEVSEETKTLARFHAMQIDVAEGWKRIAQAMRDMPTDVNSILPGGGAEGIPEGAIGATIEGGLGAPPPVPDFSPHINAIQELKNIGMDAFSGLAQGFGQMIGAWAAGADLGPKAMQKLVSSVLAGVAAQAATQAVLFTAYGIAALTPWGAAIYGNPGQWFAAAALMASVAGVAAVAGRAIAPKESGASAGASQGSGNSARSLSQQSQPQPIDTNRRMGEQRIVLEVRSNDSHIVRVVTRDYENRGEVRKVILGDGMRATA